MKSNARLTKQGIPDLNYYGPKRKPVAPVEETPATILDQVTTSVDESAKVAESPYDADAPVS